MTAADRKRLERILLLRTLITYGPLPGRELAERATTECDHDLLEDLPPVSARSITQKLNAMSLAGLVGAERTNDGLLWHPTEQGRALAASLDDIQLDEATAGAFDRLEALVALLDEPEGPYHQLALAVLDGYARFRRGEPHPFGDADDLAVQINEDETRASLRAVFGRG